MADLVAAAEFLDRAESAPRGRVKLASLAPGARYFSVYSPTGRCVYRTCSEREAGEIVGRNSDRLSYMGHTK